MKEQSISKEMELLKKEFDKIQRDFQLWKPLLTIAKIIDEGLFNRVLEFATKVSEQRKQDFIPEGSIDYELLSILKQRLERGDDPIYIKAISDCFNENKDKKIANKTISGHLDKLGFKEYREKDRYGSYLNVTREVFEIITSPLIPDFSEHSSQSSHLHINNINNSDECVTNCEECKNNSVTNVTQNDECDDYSEVGNQFSEEILKIKVEKVE